MQVKISGFVGLQQKTSSGLMTGMNWTAKMPSCFFPKTTLICRPAFQLCSSLPQQEPSSPPDFYLACSPILTQSEKDKRGFFFYGSLFGGRKLFPDSSPGRLLLMNHWTKVGHLPPADPMVGPDQWFSTGGDFAPWETFGNTWRQQ